MPKFYEKRRQKYYAVLDVPKALREQLGISRRFVKSLQTDSESIARIRVLPVIAKWKQEIALAKASGSSGNELLDTVIKVRQDTQRLKAHGLDNWEIQIVHEDVAMDAALGERNDYSGDQSLANAVSIVHGDSILLAEHIEEHLENKDSTPKSKDMARTALIAFTKEFPLAEAVTERGVRHWIIRTMERERKLSYSTIKREVSPIKMYWKWLKRYKGLDAPSPFEDVLPPAPSKNSKSKSSIDINGFSVSDYHKILGAVPEKDRNLRNLIIIGAHTGCRIEELCALRIEDVLPDRIQLVDAKTKAGMQKSGVKFVAADNPQANDLTVGILAMVAQEEAKSISNRTKAALEAAKARGQVLGAYSKDDKTKFVGRTGTREDCLKAAEGKKAKADETAQKMRQFIEDCGMSPDAPAKALARFLTEREVQTPSGRSTVWQATTVQRMKARWSNQVE